jgi:hypothetical protein
MNWNLIYHDFSYEIAIDILHTSPYSSWYLEQYIKNMDEEEFYWFMAGLTNN